MKNKPLTFSKGDVSIERIERSDCDGATKNCTIDVTHRVSIDLRGLGIMGIGIGEYCETCAMDIAKRIQATLPEDVD